MISVCLVSEMRLVREGLAQLLATGDRLQVVASVARIESLRPELLEAGVVVVADLDTASLAGVRTCLRVAPGAKIVALGVGDDEGTVLACAEAGISGFVPPGATLDDLLATVESVRRGEILCSPRTAGVLLRRVASLAGDNDSTWIEVRLTRRELQIVQLIDAGCSNKEIARRLTISLATVKNHVHNILEKLDVTRRSEAAARMRGATNHRDRGLQPLNPRI